VCRAGLRNSRSVVPRLKRHRGKRVRVAGKRPNGRGHGGFRSPVRRKTRVLGQRGILVVPVQHGHRACFALPHPAVWRIAHMSRAAGQRKGSNAGAIPAAWRDIQAPKTSETFRVLV
jgi:hypothetical protein